MRGVHCVALVSAIVLGMVALACLTATPAGAHDHRPPKPELRVAGETQRGLRYHTDWTERVGANRCAGQTSTGPNAFPGPVPVPLGNVRARIVLNNQYKPKAFKVTAWEELDQAGTPADGGTRLRTRLKPRHRQHRVVGWIAVMRLAVQDDDLYLSASGRWRDREGCGGSQTGTWRFSVAGHV